MRFLVRLLPEGTDRDALLPSIRALAKSLGAEARNPKSTSYGALELDIFAPTKADFELFVAAVEPIARFEFVNDLGMAQPHRSEADLLDEARDLFNGERYWECHEVLEGLWRQKQGDEKKLLQGIILLCAAFVHHQKGEDSVALGVLRRALPQLEFSMPGYGGFKINQLRQAAESVLRERKFSAFRV